MSAVDQGLDAAVQRAQRLIAQAWDDGNALGLDGWVGPERGEEPDEHAIRQREKIVDRIAESVVRAARSDVPDTIREAQVRAWGYGFEKACSEHGGYASCGTPGAHGHRTINPYVAASIRAGGQ